MVSTFANDALPLGLIDDLGINSEHRRRARFIERYDLSFVERRVRDARSLDDALIDKAFVEFRRFIALVVFGHKGLAVPSKEVDEIWHTFILFTREYMSFCERVAGEFIHHCPPESTLPSANNYVPYLPVYLSYFQCDPDNPVQRRFFQREDATCSGQTGCSVD